MHPIFQPVVALMLLTLLVWIYMFAQRFRYIIGNRIDAQQVATPELLNSVLPPQVNWASNNLKNLFELPVIFYAICLSIVASRLIDPLFVDLAWAYVAFRAVHSVIHCSVNKVVPRFIAYALSSAVLWAMVIRFALIVFSIANLQ